MRPRAQLSFVVITASLAWTAALPVRAQPAPAPPAADWDTGDDGPPPLGPTDFGNVKTTGPLALADVELDLAEAFDKHPDLFGVGVTAGFWTRTSMTPSKLRTIRVDGRDVIEEETPDWYWRSALFGKATLKTEAQQPFGEVAGGLDFGAEYRTLLPVLEHVCGGLTGKVALSLPLSGDLLEDPFSRSRPRVALGPFVRADIMNVLGLRLGVLAVLEPSTGKTGLEALVGADWSPGLWQEVFPSLTRPSARDDERR